MEDLINLIFEELKNEIEEDVNYNAKALLSKVKSAVREVRNIRAYPTYYIESDIVEELNSRYYDVIKNLAMYDYNQLGSEFETSHSEGEISRTYVERTSIVAKVIPLAKNV